MVFGCVLFSLWQKLAKWEGSVQVCLPNPSCISFLWTGGRQHTFLFCIHVPPMSHQAAAWSGACNR